MAARLLGVRDVFGFGLGSQVRWVRGPTLPDDLRDAHQIDKLQAFFKQHDIPVPSQEPLLVLPSTQIDAQRDHFRASPRPWVMLGVGARNLARRWPSESFCALVERVDAVGTWFVLGGLDEFDAIERDIVARAASSSVVNISHAKMAEAAALVSACDLFIGNDSGPMNVAAAVGTNTLGLFGVTPALTHSNYIHPLSSSQNDRRMEGIAVEDVAGLASRLLGFDKPPCTSP
jgi:heptosyltransferase-2